LKATDHSDTIIVESLIRDLADMHKSVQRGAIDRLVALAASGNSEVIERLRDSMTSDDRRVRWAAAYALAQIGADAFAMDSADALIEAMADDDGDIRWAATNLMVRLGRENFNEITSRLYNLASGSDRNARKMALYCIRDLKIAGPDLIPVVENAVHDFDVHVRLAALAVLSRLRGVPEAGRIMLECLKSDTDAGVRRAAASALGNVDGVGADAITALNHAASDASDESLAKAARGALERLEKFRLEKR
jgi:HEAT repeat protein